MVPLAYVRFSDFSIYTFSNQRARIIDLENKISQMAAKLAQAEKEKNQLLLLQKAQEKDEGSVEQTNTPPEKVEKPLFEDDDEEPTMISTY